MALFTITTNKEVAEKVEKFFKSGILSEGRSMKLNSINHYPGHSIIAIESKDPEGLINPSDIFWMGFYSAEK